MSDEVFAAVVANTAVRAETDDAALMQALLRTESALTRAQAKAGLVSGAAAAAVERACAMEFDLNALVRDTSRGGNPVIPLVEQIRSRVGDNVADDVHRGATSQDILDTAIMLMTQRSLDVVLGDVERVIEALGNIEVGDFQMTARTLMQKALPISFDDKIAVWQSAADDIRQRLENVRDNLPIQLGGPVGNGSSLGGSYKEIRGSFAAQLGLVDARCWHTVRLPIADLAAALAATCGVVAKISGDIILLAQTEVGEVSESGEDSLPGGQRGGSSSMAHKSNPIAAISARASARRAPFLAAHLFAQMEQEHERAAGAWHAEWSVLVDLLRATGSAGNWLAESLERLVIDTDAMEKNL